MRIFPVIPFLYGCIGYEGMTALFTLSQARKDIVTVILANLNITLTKHLYTVESGRVDNLRAVIRVTPVFPLVKRIPQSTGDSFITKIAVVLINEVQESTTLAIMRFKIIKHIISDLDRIGVNVNLAIFSDS